MALSQDNHPENEVVLNLTVLWTEPDKVKFGGSVAFPAGNSCFAPLYLVPELKLRRNQTPRIPDSHTVRRFPFLPHLPVRIAGMVSLEWIWQSLLKKEMYSALD